ncbi:hypothetical protein NEUTE2DRAFT_135333 [Neurospora tetrasperma FGSC 2509]|nr:hypothetical protein NEUTE2DRAFT_135333 [Neurospora tetrasperma FGSC 2509]
MAVGWSSDGEKVKNIHDGLCHPSSFQRAFHSMLLSRGRAKSLEPEPVKVQGPKACPDTHETINSVHVRLSANLNGYETGSLSDVGLQTVLDDDNYMFVHAVSGARDDPGNGSSLGDYTRGAALDHGRLLQLR